MSVRQMTIVWELDVEDAEQSILLVLADHADDEGRGAHPSLQKIEWRTGMDRRTVQRHLRAMTAHEWIEVVRPGGGRRSTEYRLHLHRVPRKIAFDEWRSLNNSEKRELRLARRKRKREVLGKGSEGRQNDTPNQQPARNPANHEGRQNDTPAEGRQNDTSGVSPLRRPRGDILGGRGEPSVNRPRTLPPAADAATPSGGDGGDDPGGKEKDLKSPPGSPDLDREVAQARMHEIADRHPYLLLFSGARRTAVRATLTKHINGEFAHIWTDANGDPVPWRLRPEALDLALSQLVQGGGSIENKIRLVAVPQLTDPFRVRKAENAAPPSPGGGLGASGALSLIELPPNLSRDAADRVRRWTEANPEEAVRLAQEMIDDPKWKANPGAGYTIEATRRAKVSA